VGADIRPLFHFWGIYPQNAATLGTAITNAGLAAPVEIYDTLVRYKSLVPPNNSAFTNFAYKWWNGKPSINGYWEEREHARQWDTNALYSAGDQQRSEATNPGEIYNENSAFDITNRVQELINLYYPSGRPTSITPPAILGFSPADGVTNVAVNENLVVTFNKSIVRGTGNITLKNLTDGTQTTIAITNTAQVSIAGEVLTINPTANLLTGKTYAIHIAPTALGGLATNVFAGITNDTTWNFSTTNPDVSAPLLLTLNPADGATNVALAANLVATFNEPIQIGTGNITLKNLTDATQITIAITNAAQVSVSNAVLTINPATNLLAGKSYALQIAATAIDDLAGNSFAGITNDTAWNFTTLTDFAIWTAKYPGANLADPNADFDGDGLSNNYERIWGLNPTNAASRNLFASIVNLKTGNFSYTRRTQALTGLSYTVWTSTNMLSWTQDSGAIQTPGAPVAEVETVAVTISPALLNQPRLHIRMRAQ
jgi:methionine-rich copper-binding protein CopC